MTNSNNYSKEEAKKVVWEVFSVLIRPEMYSSEHESRTKLSYLLICRYFSNPDFLKTDMSCGKKREGDLIRWCRKYGTIDEAFETFLEVVRERISLPLREQMNELFFQYRGEIKKEFELILAAEG